MPVSVTSISPDNSKHEDATFHVPAALPPQAVTFPQSIGSTQGMVEVAGALVVWAAAALALMLATVVGMLCALVAPKSGFLAVPQPTSVVDATSTKPAKPMFAWVINRLAP